MKKLSNLNYSNCEKKSKFHNSESGKIWTLLSVVVFVMTCSVAVWAATITNKPAENQENKKFDPRKIEQMGEVLSGTDWDNLMDTLNEWTVPAGAIMAFDSKDGCPDGWEEWHESDGRFLMGGSKDDIGLIGGKEKTTLTINEMPNHWHYLTSNHGAGKSDEWLDRVLDSTIAYAHTSDDGAGNDKYILKGVDNIPNAGRSSSVGGGKEFSILNPYYKVIFCKKSNNVEPVNAACNNSVEFSCSKGSVIESSKVSNDTYQYTWTCGGINGGEDAKCIKCIDKLFGSEDGIQGSILTGKDTNGNLYCYQKGECGAKTLNGCRGGKANNLTGRNTAGSRQARTCEGININNSEMCGLCNGNYVPDMTPGPNLTCISINKVTSNSNIHKGCFRGVYKLIDKDGLRDIVDDTYALPGGCKH